ncbi:phage tail protein [Salmonella enterica subsp. enterica]|nr:phage tail protein [Salmonella enterica subsp. enterica serovar Miami]EEI9132879.1 phage tail protein [Salmonella enterica subsp. enterica serovar Miami]EEJ1578181.1 phage tail protein [Salmonella enterica subsp. enterica serovar Miami]EEJ2837932.1 phage tail protein [Salmonella enterica subsp. enterica serovar Miami]
MSVLISGALVDGAGIPLSGCHIILKSRVNTSEVVMRTIADVVTGNNGEYSFEAQAGKYCVYLKQDWRDEYCVGDISVYHDAKPGTLNDFLTALSEDDLKPDVVRRFEEMVAQAQQSAEAAAKSERLAGQHAADAQKIKENCQTLADNVRQNAEAVAGNVQKAEKLASETAQNAARAEQAASDADMIVKKAVDKLGEAATLTGEAKASAEAAARSEQNAKGHADNAAGSAQQTAQDVTAATTARQDAERFANEAEKSAQASGTARDESVGAAESARRYHNAASSAATSAELSANTARGHANTATEQARRAKESQDTSAGNAQEAKQYRDEAQQIVDGLNATNASTTEKGLVQLCSATDNDSEALAATPKAVKTVMDEVKTKAPLDSPVFTGTPTTPTPPDDAAGLEMANAAFVRKLLARLVDSSPETLDTLNELAAALGNDPNFATTMTNALAGKQPLSDVLTSLSSLPATGNKMPYFSDKNVMALANLTAVGRELTGQNSKGEVLDYLGLKGAGTKDVQTGIRDRTPGRVAIPGAFGYGHMFKSSDALTFRGPSDFAEWLKEATPERYAVSIADSSALLAGTSKFNGIIEVMWSPFDNDESDTTRKFKTLMCYNQYYEGEHSIHCLRYRFSGDNWNATATPLVYDGDSLAFLLSRTAGSGSYYKYPAVGVPVLAVYQGTSAGDREIKIGLGDIVQGSRLGPVAMTCAINDQGPYISTPQVTAGGAGSYSFPGRYQALSGHRAEYGSRGLICLFVRIE